VAFYRDFVVALLQGSCRPSACPVTSLWETTLSSPRNDFGAASLVILVHEYNAPSASFISASHKEHRRLSYNVESFG
jgi:hypothetical protein